MHGCYRPRRITDMNRLKTVIKSSGPARTINIPTRRASAVPPRPRII